MLLHVATCSWCPSPKKYSRQKLFNTELCHSDSSGVPGSTVIPNSTPEQRLSTGNWSFGSHALNLLKQCETSKPCKTGKGWKRWGDQSDQLAIWPHESFPGISQSCRSNCADKSMDRCWRPAWFFAAKADNSEVTSGSKSWSKSSGTMGVAMGVERYH